MVRTFLHVLLHGMPVLEQFLHLWHHDGFLVFQVRLIGLHVRLVGFANIVHIPALEGFVEGVFVFVQLVVSVKETVFRRDVVTVLVQDAVAEKKKSFQKH